MLREVHQEQTHGLPVDKTRALDRSTVEQCIQQTKLYSISAHNIGRSWTTIVHIFHSLCETINIKSATCAIDYIITRL